MKYNAEKIRNRMQKKYEIWRRQNMKQNAEKILNMVLKKIKYCTEKNEKLCRKILNIAQKYIQYGA